MPINKIPIAENSRESDERSTKGIKREIERIVSYLKYNDKIFKEWNLQSVIKQHNLSVNLYGESGTGKTMTAHAIAKMLNKKIVLVDYAEIESKYVGREFPKKR